MLYRENSAQDLEEFLTEVQTREESPMQEHMDFLRSVVRRLELEARTEQGAKRKRVPEEPICLTWCMACLGLEKVSS